MCFCKKGIVQTKQTAERWNEVMKDRKGGKFQINLYRNVCICCKYEGKVSPGIPYHSGNKR